MVGPSDLVELARVLEVPSCWSASPFWDRRIDALQEGWQPQAAELKHVKHQALLRAYQDRYVLLPPSVNSGSVLELLRRYEASNAPEMLRKVRTELEKDLVAPQIDAVRAAPSGSFTEAADGILRDVGAAPETPLLAYFRTAGLGPEHYRDFLLQSSADLLAEASASALGIVGEFGAPQSALFRILIDEFGYGIPSRKHSVLFQGLMRSFELSDSYNSYWHLFYTETLNLHNWIHYVFQNPRNIFLQVGFLMYAEVAYQRATLDHDRYLAEFHPRAARHYFTEHAHIDVHHSHIVLEEVAAPLVALYGDDAGAEIVAGAQMTRAIFDRQGQHLVEVHRAFESARVAGRAAYHAPMIEVRGMGIAPGSPFLQPSDLVKVGGLGSVSAEAYSAFPDGTYGRVGCSEV